MSANCNNKRASELPEALFAPVIYAMLKIGGHLVGIPRLSTSLIFRNQLNLDS